MPQSRRDRDTERSDRDAGFNAGVGLLRGRRRRDRVDGRTCAHCGAEARIDMIDMARTRVYLTCLSCGNEWDLDHLSVVRGDAG